MRLNVEQRKIIELEPAGHSLVKGVAGSGKTTVAIRRIGFLQNHYCPEDDDNVLLVTFNKTLLKYIKYQFENLKDEEMTQNFLQLLSEKLVKQLRHEEYSKLNFGLSYPLLKEILKETDKGTNERGRS